MLHLAKGLLALKNWDGSLVCDVVSILWNQQEVSDGGCVPSAPVENSICNPVGSVVENLYQMIAMLLERRQCKLLKVGEP